MKKKILIEFEIETDSTNSDLESAILRGLDYGLDKYDVCDDQVNPEIKIYTI